MSVTISGTTGVATPGVQNSASESITGNETIGGTLAVTGAITAGSLQVGGVATNLYPLVSGTAQATTSGTAFDFTIPATAKRITVMFAGVVHNGNNTVVQIGAGTVVNTGYVDTAGFTASGNVAGATSYTDGFNWERTTTTQACIGSMVLTLLDASTNTWCASLAGATVTGSLGSIGGGYISISGTLTTVRVTSTGGTGVFSAGKVNVMWE